MGGLLRRRHRKDEDGKVQEDKLSEAQKKSAEKKLAAQKAQSSKKKLSKGVEAAAQAVASSDAGKKDSDGSVGQAKA